MYGVLRGILGAIIQTESGTPQAPAHFTHLPY